MIAVCSLFTNFLKTSRPGKHVSTLTFTAYSPDSRLCPIVCLSEYDKRTNELRKGSDQLLVSYQKPYQPVSTDTITRWLKTVLAKSGIDTSVFKGHSTRAASTSEAAVCKVPLSTIYPGQCRLLKCHNLWKILQETHCPNK